eukprot:jgi/Bigna1/86155/estExt_fgenesh1_pg.C_80201
MGVAYGCLACKAQNSLIHGDCKKKKKKEEKKTRKKFRGKNGSFHPIKKTSDRNTTTTGGETTDDTEWHDKLSRWKVEQEIVQKEEDYLRNLQILEVCYRVPMENNSNTGLSDEDVRTLFGNIKQIHILHINAIERLKRARFSKDESITKKIEQAADEFQIYSTYTLGLGPAFKLIITHLEEDNLFKEFLRSQMSEETELLGDGEDAKGLWFYLKLPFTHLSDLANLMRRMVEATACENDEYKNACIAYGKIQMISNWIENMAPTISTMVAEIEQKGEILRGTSPVEEEDGEEGKEEGHKDEEEEGKEGEVSSPLRWKNFKAKEQRYTDDQMRRIKEEIEKLESKISLLDNSMANIDRRKELNRQVSLKRDEYSFYKSRVQKLSTPEGSPNQASEDMASEGVLYSPPRFSENVEGISNVVEMQQSPSCEGVRREKQPAGKHLVMPSRILKEVDVDRKVLKPKPIANTPSIAAGKLAATGKTPNRLQLVSRLGHNRQINAKPKTQVSAGSKSPFRRIVIESKENANHTPLSMKRRIGGMHSRYSQMNFSSPFKEGKHSNKKLRNRSMNGFSENVLDYDCKCPNTTNPGRRELSFDMQHILVEAFRDVDEQQKGEISTEMALSVIIRILDQINAQEGKGELVVSDVHERASCMLQEGIMEGSESVAEGEWVSLFQHLPKFECKLLFFEWTHLISQPSAAVVSLSVGAYLE